MKALVFNGENHSDLVCDVASAGFDVVRENPEIIFSCGGDGTFMRAEHAYPGVPKIPLRASAVCKLCAVVSNEDVLKRIADGKYRIEEFWKLSAEAKGKKYIGVNDVIVHNKDPRHAIRYDVFINDKRVRENVIGDGIVVATPFGGTGYYRSITDSYFEVGMGLAFNNSTEESDHIVLKEDSVVRVTIARGPAIVYVDNRNESIELEEGDGVEIKKSDQVARIVRVED